MAKNANSKAKRMNSDDLSQERLERIRQRAYQLYEAGGREEGHDIDHWLQAEAEFSELMARPTDES
jgi:hypothetical protein